MSSLVLSFTLFAPAQPAAAAGAANDHTVLILDSTISGGMASREATAAIAIGRSVEIVSAAGWAAKTTADFASYRALVLGDPTCGEDTSPIAAAMTSTAVWGPAVNGRVIINGTDPVFHDRRGGANLSTGSVQFAAGEATKTGMYVSLSCYYDSTAAHTAVPLLDAFSPGGFTVTGVGCYNNAHIVATHPALSAVTDATLSGWSCSVHEAFDKWPAADFDVLAIARGFGTSFVASDGTVGTPYVLARGATVISDITLAPLTGTSSTGTAYTLSATVKEGGSPTAGRTVTFNAIGGPNNGLTLTGTAPTNANGQTTASYTSTVIGTDTWVARFMDSSERTQTSGRVTVDWGATAVPPAGPRVAVVKVNSPSCGQVAVSATGLTPFLQYQFVVTPSTGDPLVVVDVTADASGAASTTVDLTKAFGASGGTYLAYARLISGFRYSNTATVTAAACASPTPTPTSVPTRTPPSVITPPPAPTPAPAAVPPPPTPAPVGLVPSTVGLVPSTVGRLPSTSTGDDGIGTAAVLLLGLLTVGAIAWRRRPTRT